MKADRYNEGKIRYSLIPSYALKVLAQVMTKGAEKYSDDNWRKGMKYTDVLDSIFRHLEAFRSGEDLDKETGLPHLGHLMANICFLLEYSLTHTELDNRIKQHDSKPDKNLNNLVTPPLMGMNDQNEFYKEFTTISQSDHEKLYPNS